MKWILILVNWAGYTPSQIMAPGYYETAQSCQDAGAIYSTARSMLDNKRRHFCIPVDVPTGRWRDDTPTIPR